MSAKIGVHTKEVQMPFEVNMGPVVSISSYLAEVLQFDDLHVDRDGNVHLHKELILARLDRLTERIEAL